MSNWSSAQEGVGSTTLTSGARYYLSPTTAGTITSTTPSTAGRYVMRIGFAINTTTLRIDKGTRYGIN